jgi:hypothetical protein
MCAIRATRPVWSGVDGDIDPCHCRACPGSSSFGTADEPADDAERSESQTDRQAMTRAPGCRPSVPGAGAAREPGPQNRSAEARL